MLKIRIAVGFFLAAILSVGSTNGQLVPKPHQPKSDCWLQILAQHLADELQDWNQVGYYYEENRRILEGPAEPGRVVFIGDSITEGWNLRQYFPGKPYINRGISGQTTPQMLVRMFPDVINLHLAAVVILAGTNDIGAVTGPETLEMVEDNIRAMGDLARAHDIRIILGLVLPVSDYTAYKQTVKRPPTDILKLNEWLRSYAAEIRAEVADYFSALVDTHGMLKDGYSNDGVHPNDRGHEVMGPVAEAAIEKAMK